MKLKILLADDHKLMREGLRALLEKAPDFRVVGEAGNGREAVRQARELKPDIVVMDIGMPDLNGIEATRQILAEAPHVKVIALSMYADKRYVAGMLEAGAAGFLTKDSAYEELISAVRAVSAHHIYIGHKVRDAVIVDYVSRLGKSAINPEPALTTKERELIQLLAEGKSTKEIAALMKVSIKTAETHRQNIMKKLDIHSIAELTKYALRKGLTSL
ncbi:MAG: response regulator transcription factor [Candidatus Sumerlaeota bacterium]|nr:response regulator transcription factor [Candidatus Sumerlaeota bacterium]